MKPLPLILITMLRVLSLGESCGSVTHKEAEEILSPLPRIAPKRAEPRVEYGIVLLELQRYEDAVTELRRALQLEEASWATNLYLGWALLESRPEEAGPYFKRALELNERKAARAHLALARLADERGMRQLAIQHLDAIWPSCPTRLTRKLPASSPISYAIKTLKSEL